MKKLYKFSLIFFSIITLSSCEERIKNYQESDFDTVLRLSREHTSKIPTELRKQLEDDYFTLSERPIDRTETQKKVALKALTREYMPFEAYLIDRGGSLKKQNYLFKMDGGSEIDFAEYTSGKKGDFLFGILLDPKFTKDNTLVYYLDNRKSQGCNEYKEITDYFFDNVVKKPLLTTTDDFIHLKLLNGAIVLISNVNDEYYLGQIFLTDSRIKKLLCR